MAFDVAAFRENFPDFSSTTTYPDSMLTYWGSIATTLHNYDRFTDMYDHILSLYVAHKAIMQAINISESKNNAVPNQFAGALTGTTIGGVTTNYKGSSTSITKSSASAGEFEETIYGRQYWNLLNMYVATPLVM